MPPMLRPGATNVPKKRLRLRTIDVVERVGRRQTRHDVADITVQLSLELGEFALAA